MRGLILAAVSFVLLVACSAIGLQVYRGNRQFTVLLGAFAASLGIYGFLFTSLPPNLWFLPAAALEPAPAVDFFNGLVVLTTVFHGFWVFTYALWTGPTMSLLGEMSRQGHQGITSEDALSFFGQNEAMNLILRRRLPKLIKGGYLEKDGDTYRLLPRGLRTARACLLCKKIVGVGAE